MRLKDREDGTCAFPVSPIAQHGSWPSGRLLIQGPGTILTARDTREIREKTMTESHEAYVADLHTKAAYAHIAAAHQHSTGDHASAQELAQMALGNSLKA